VFQFYLQILTVAFLILRRTERDMIKNVYRSSCKVPVILSVSKENRVLLTDFRKNTYLSNFMKILSVDASYSMWTDRQTDTKNLIVTCGNFGKIA
jgi:hypothetical protein